MKLIFALRKMRKKYHSPVSHIYKEYTIMEFLALTIFIL